MPLGGVAEFAVPYLLDRVYIAGTWVDRNDGIQEEPGPVEPSWGLPTHGGSHIFQRPYRGPGKPKERRALRFTIPWQADGDAAWYAVQRAKAACAPFYFTTGMRKTDCFPAITGEGCRLTSPLAAGIVPGVTEGDFPTLVYLDGDLTPSAATVTGQDVMPAADGNLCVEYTPVHWVRVVSMAETLAAHNDLQADIVLEQMLVS